MAAIKITSCWMPSRMFKKNVRNKHTAEVRQMALKMRASNENPGGRPIILAQNDRIVLLFK